MNKNCLYCYRPLEKEDFHEHCSVAFFGAAEPPTLIYTLDQMAELARDVVERSIAVPGVQPKISLTLLKEGIADAHTSRLTVVEALGGQFILKPPSLHYEEMPANEHVTMRIAEAFGISTVPSSLIHLASGELAYITRRIDRSVAGEKIHMLDMFQITEAYDKYKSSMEKIGKAVRKHAANTGLDSLYLLELTVFCFLTGNNDMHLKNFSLIKDSDQWKLSPAYDLLNVAIVNPEDEEELALTLEGKKKKLKKEHFIRFGLGLSLTERQIDGVFRRFERNKHLAMQWIEKSYLSAAYKEAYIHLLKQRYQRLELV